jgi:hypothetical protein
MLDDAQGALDDEIMEVQTHASRRCGLVRHAAGAFASFDSGG